MSNSTDDLEEDLNRLNKPIMVLLMRASELIDAMRVVPRLVLAGYMYVVYTIIKWYIEFEIVITHECDSNTLKVLLDSGILVDAAKDIACSPSAILGRPDGYTVLVTVMVGASAAVFGMYTNSGRSWNGSKKAD